MLVGKAYLHCAHKGRVRQYILLQRIWDDWIDGVRDIIFDFRQECQLFYSLRRILENLDILPHENLVIFQQDARKRSSPTRCRIELRLRKIDKIILQNIQIFLYLIVVALQLRLISEHQNKITVFLSKSFSIT